MKRKKVKKIILFLSIIGLAQAQMTFNEFMTSFKEEFGSNMKKGKNHVIKVYEKNKENNPEHAVVDTTQDVVKDAGAAYWGLTKEAYRDAKILYYKHQLKKLEEEKQNQE